MNLKKLYKIKIVFTKKEKKKRKRKKGKGKTILNKKYFDKHPVYQTKWKHNNIHISNIYIYIYTIVNN